MKNYSNKLTITALLLSIILCMACGSDDTEFPKQELKALVLLNPENKVINSVLRPTLKWEEVTSNNNAISYDLYLGTEENPKLYKENIKDTHFKVTEELIETTQYYWKVIAKDGNNGTAESGIFSFTTDQAIDVNSLSTTKGLIDTKIWIRGNG
ncbi:hypothetical protein, partial [Aquimarina megaterium]|uniref:hypothetical protein n=1 Tax=Aquimarina megaterium TaxID=1443666 RepID=UPI00054EDF9E